MKKMLKGMSMREYAEIVAFVQNNHPFAGMSKNKIALNEYFHIKYIDNIYDSRTQQIWSVSFRGLGTNIRFSTNYFVMHGRASDDFKFTTLYEWIMEFLRIEWKPSEYMQKTMNI